MTKAPSYWDYIRVEELLALQSGLAERDADLENDEVRFIVIHQIDELWFKLALRELDSARDLFAQPRVPETALQSVSTSLRRLSMIFELAGNHFRLMETMSTRDYLKFRDKLFPASGFQSAQLREMEVSMGLDDEDRIPFGHEGSYLRALESSDGSPSPALERVRRRLGQPTLKHGAYRWLHRTPIDGSSPGDPGDDGVVEAVCTRFVHAHRDQIERMLEERLRVQALTDADRDRLERRYRAELNQAEAWLRAEDVEDPARRTFQKRLRAAILFIDSNRELPLLSWPAQIIDGLIEAEQSMLIFRQRHARMVERVIGRRVGTGGSAGVDYLDQTALGYRVFKELWAARTLLLSPDQAPPAANEDFYGLRVGS